MCSITTLSIENPTSYLLYFTVAVFLLCFDIMKVIFLIKWIHMREPVMLLFVICKNKAVSFEQGRI